MQAEELNPVVPKAAGLQGGGPGAERARQSPNLAPVKLETDSADAVTHSLSVLSTIYHYNHWVFCNVREYVGGSVLEVGAGIGNITEFLLNCNTLVCMEPFAPYREYLARRFAQHLNVRVAAQAIEDCPSADVPAESFDTLICLNVLEHIEDDVAALRTFRRLLKPKGRAVVLVPAMPMAYGALDRAMGHHRRYSRRMLRCAFEAAGLRPVHSRYMNMLGAFGWLLQSRIRGRTTIPEAQTRQFDRMVPVLSAIETIIPPPFGQSLVMVGEP